MSANRFGFWGTSPLDLTEDRNPSEHLRYGPQMKIPDAVTVYLLI